MVNNPELDLEYVIDKVEGDIIFIDNANLPNSWKNIDYTYITVEVFRRKTVQSPLFHEIALTCLCDDGVIEIPQRVWLGDNYRIDTTTEERLAFLFDNILEDIKENNDGWLFNVGGKSAEYFPQRIDDVIETPAYATGGQEAEVESSGTGDTTLQCNISSNTSIG